MHRQKHSQNKMQKPKKTKQKKNRTKNKIMIINQKTNSQAITTTREVMVLPGVVHP
jgi:hypothetical protein